MRKMPSFAIYPVPFSTLSRCKKLATTRNRKSSVSHKHRHGNSRTSPSVPSAADLTLSLWRTRTSFSGFAAPLGQKDIRLTLAAAEDLRVPLPLASLLRDRFLSLLAHGGDKLDWSAIGQLAARDAGELGG